MSKSNAHLVHTFMNISKSYSASIHLHRMFKSNAHLVHISEKI